MYRTDKPLCYTRNFGRLIPRPFHLGICCLLQATNTGVRRPGNKASNLGAAHKVDVYRLLQYSATIHTDKLHDTVN